jgi:hypothetical protein
MFAALHARLYLALVASFCLLGVCLTFAQPVFSLPDEPAHWLTANVRVERMFGRSGCVPTVLSPPCPRKHICSSIPSLSLTCSEDIGVYGDLFTYPGVLLSKLLLPRQTESAIRQIQGIVLSRLLQGLVVVLALVRAGMLAQRTRRLGALSLAALTLSPLLAQQAFAVSSDGVQLALGVCLFSAVLYWDALTRSDVVLFAVLGYASAAKPSILPLLLPSVLAAYWFAELQKPETPGVAELARGLWRALKPTRVPSPQTLLLWTALLMSALTVVFALRQDAVGQEATPVAENVARVAHLQELRDHPLRIFSLVDGLRYDLRKAQHWVGPLGWLDLWVAPAVLHAFLRILGLAASLELGYFGWHLWRTREARVALPRRLGRALPPLAVGVLVQVVNVLFMTAVMYVLWTPITDHNARGVQLRYFFPASMVMIAVLFRTLYVVVMVARGARRLDLAAPAPRPDVSEKPPESALLSSGNSLPARAVPRALTRWLVFLAPCLVLALSLPYVARVYVDLSVRYHNPAKYPAPE